MATNQIILCLLCSLALCSSSRTQRHHLTSNLVSQSSSADLQFTSSTSSADLQIRVHKTSRNAPNNAYLHLITIAQKEIGTREADVPNAGKKVSEYLRYTGIKVPAPWCAAWLSYVFGQAGYPAPKTAWSPALFPLARQVPSPAPGLVLGIYYASLKRVGHCGIIERVSGDWCMSIEGNTSATNERDGDGVWRKTRHKRSIHCYADWIKGQNQVGGKI